MRAEIHAYIGKGANGNHITIGIAHMHAEDVFHRSAVPFLGLQTHAPASAKQVEVIDVIAAHGRLQRGEDIADGNAQHLRPVTIQIKKDRRCRRREGGKDPRQISILIGGNDQGAHDRGHFTHRPAFQILQLVLKATTGAKAHNGRQVEGQDQGRNLHRAARNRRDQRIHLRLGRCAFLKGFQRHDEEGAIGLRQAIQHGKARNSLHRRHTRQCLNDRFHLLGQFLGAIERCAIRQLHFSQEGALVFLRQEARWCAAGNAENPKGNHAKQHQAEGRKPDQAGDNRAIAIAYGINKGRNLAHDALLRPVMRLQQYGAKGG